jgi:hypothetical protein
MHVVLVRRHGVVPPFGAVPPATGTKGERAAEPPTVFAPAAPPPSVPQPAGTDGVPVAETPR